MATFKDMLGSAVDQAKAQLGDKDKIIETVKDKAPEIIETVKDKAPEIIETVKDKAPDVLSSVQNLFGKK